MMKKFYYDTGWNERVGGKPFVHGRGQDYSDGWKDCDEYLKQGGKKKYI